MNKNYQCPRCLRKFSSSQRVQSHLKRKILCDVVDENKALSPDLQTLTQSNQNNDPFRQSEYPKIVNEKQYICEFCGIGFTRKDNLIAHQKKSCKVINISPEM